MSNAKSSNSGGIGFAGLLTLVFITLKLCRVIAWSWWWVLSPIWITFLIAVVMFAPFYVVTLWLNRTRTPQEKVAALCHEIAERLRRRE